MTLQKYTVEFWGDVDVEASSPEEAVAKALEKVTLEPDSHLFWDTELALPEDEADDAAMLPTEETEVQS